MSSREATTEGPEQEHTLTALDRVSTLPTAWTCACGETFLDPARAARHADRVDG